MGRRARGRRRSTWSRSVASRWRRRSRASCRGSPTTCVRKILDRAEGVPLYAMETVRMLLDRALLVRSTCVPAGRGRRHARGARDAARADRGPARRFDAGRAATDPGRGGAGQDVHVPGIAAVSGMSEAEVEPLLACARAQGDRRAAVRSFVARARAVRVPAGPGELGRVRDALEEGAEARHVAAAAFIESTWGADEDEIVEVVAAHLDEALPAGYAMPRTRWGFAGGAAEMLSARASAQARCAAP